MVRCSGYYIIIIVVYLTKLIIIQDHVKTDQHLIIPEAPCLKHSRADLLEVATRGDTEEPGTLREHRRKPEQQVKNKVYSSD